MQILDIFLLFGAPNILQSDNGVEFTANVISELNNLWPECKIVHGKPRHPQSQGSIERGNADVKDMVITWMRDNHCKDLRKTEVIIQPKTELHTKLCLG
ncbi:KRAB-A domain-containing protein 2-like [Mytilus trossulus]|uniref:KRAB-A domain-containing protein 2-like n=1 Tax=Mytilus trossulus TaxID=6551 RepID=UPI0030075F2F